ncbi:translocation/assembly module TamB domain-containing protein [Rickettsiella endosymbiont of Litargus connexus]|jgi:translocation and assembly module TamB|uniref:translocation/assembly module TamB domain-containing protein n=1 Tax=Rickettsiella endosymbiont of Litargus connexus TaxID=3066237 RepID=UPI00376F2946
MINSKKLSWVKWLLRSLLISVFLLSSYIVLNTERGLETVILVGKQFLPGQLKINVIHGRLLGPIQLKELNYQNSKINLSISEIKWESHWRNLLQGKLNLGPIFIDKLNLFIKQKSSQKKSKTYQKKTFQIPKIFHFLNFDSVVIHQMNIQADNIRLELKGSIQSQWHINWQLTIKKPTSSIPNLHGKVVLQGSIIGIFQQPKFNLVLEKTNLKWKECQFKQIQAALNIDTKSNKWFFNLATTQFNNKTFKLAPVRLKLSGSLSPFSLQGNLSEFKLNRLVQDGQLTKIIIPNTQINSYLSKYGLETSLQTFKGNRNQLFAYLLLSNYQAHSWLKSKQPIHASIDLNFKDLNFLTQLFPKLKNNKGSFNAQLKISGLLNKPLFKLTVNLQQASTYIPVLGLNLKNITYQLHTNKNILLGSGQIDSGKGSLKFHTSTNLLKHNLSTLIDIQGKDITIISNPEYQITASPKLKIKANTQQIETDGYIAFPKARMKINPKNNNLIELSNDIEFVGKKKQALILPFSLKSKIKIEAGKDILLQYQGLNTKLKGSLTIIQDSDHPVLATGQLKLFSGEYSYYGQSLKLKPSSSLNFANTPINNPTINITASRNILILPVLSTPDISNEVKSKLGSNNFIQSGLFSSQSMPISVNIGLYVRGTLQNPYIILFSNPSNIIKSQLDMLSYLITGQPSNQLSAASTQLLLNAASNLGSEKNNIGQLISKVQQKMGLDQLTIGSKPIFDPTTNRLQQNTSLIVGKNLSPKLNISYSLGLLDQISILEINYLLNKNFSLQTTSSNFANGLDLFYKLEKN